MNTPHASQLVECYVTEEHSLLDRWQQALFKAIGFAESGRGAVAAGLMQGVQFEMRNADIGDLASATVTHSERNRPPREGNPKTGRYASLTITALEEAENWHRRRLEAAAS